MKVAFSADASLWLCSFKFLDVSDAVISNHNLLMGLPITINILHSLAHSVGSHFLDSVLAYLHSSWNVCPGGNLKIWEYYISSAISTTTQGGWESSWCLSTAHVQNQGYIINMDSAVTGRVML